MGNRLAGSVIWLHSSSSSRGKERPSMSVNVLAAHVTPTTCTEERRWVSMGERATCVFRCMWVDVCVCVSVGGCVGVWVMEMG